MLEVKENNNGICLSCCDKNKSTKEIIINTHKGINIVTFCLCNECLNKLAREFHKFS